MNDDILALMATALEQAERAMRMTSHILTAAACGKAPAEELVDASRKIHALATRLHEIGELLSRCRRIPPTVH